MKTHFVFDNSGNRVEVISDLKEGQRLLCKKTQRSSSGVGLWGSPDDRYDSFEEGKIYKVSFLSNNWGSKLVAYVVDEDGCSTWARPETFQVL